VLSIRFSRSVRIVSITAALLVFFPLSLRRRLRKRRYKRLVALRAARQIQRPKGK